MKLTPGIFGVCYFAWFLSIPFRFFFCHVFFFFCIHLQRWYHLKPNDLLVTLTDSTCFAVIYTDISWFRILKLSCTPSIFWQKNIGAKAPRKIFVKLTIGFTTKARRKIIDPHRMELHFDRSEDFGSIVECFAENRIGASLSNTTIPGFLLDFHYLFQRKDVNLKRGHLWIINFNLSRFLRVFSSRLRPTALLRLVKQM